MNTETLFLILQPVGFKWKVNVVLCMVWLLQAALTNVSQTFIRINIDHLRDYLNAEDFCLFSPLSW